MNRKHDYDLMEREYVSGDMSLRELGRMHQVTHSLVMGQSTKREWVRKREEFRSQASNRAVSFMADKAALRAVREMEVRDDALELIAESIAKSREDMKRTHMVLKNNQWVEEPVMILRPADISSLIDRLQVLFGKPSSITEERSLGITIGGTASPELLAGFIESTRGLDGGTTQESPLPSSDKPREN